MAYLETAIDAYHEIKDNGLLKKLQFEVYEIIVFNPGQTIREICKEMQKRYRNIQDRSVCARVVECRDKGTVSEGPNKVCSISGRVVATWIATNQLPKKLEKKKTKDEIIKELREKIAILEGKVSRLEDPFDLKMPTKCLMKIFLSYENKPW